MYYPLFLDIRRSHCLVVGAGAVALRKVQSLLKSGAECVMVLDISPLSSAWDLVRTHRALRFEKRPFQEEDLQGKSLVFVCTAERELNERIARLCGEHQILCNCVDAPHEGNFIVPALAQVSGDTAEKASLMAAVSTEGASPAWSRVLRKELEEWLKPHAPMTVFLGRLRPMVLALGQKTSENTELFRNIVHSPLRYLLVEGTQEDCAVLLQELLPVNLHPHIAELLYDII